ncbi:MAG: glucosaminidase domain-containing protein [Synergistaceae bacterium]|nr:glucosaminidase domain-containing protein [Synergistaceae bacterium]
MFKIINMAIKAAAFVAALFIFSGTACAMTAPEFYVLARGRPCINAFAVTVQSAVETGHWKSYLWVNAYNGAGIKAPASWRSSGRAYIRVSSPESVNGKYIMRESYFRFYSSPEEFLQDYRLKIIQDYPRSASSADNMWGYFAGLYNGRQGSWATDHGYYEKLAKKAVQLEANLLPPGHLKRAFEYAKKHKCLEQWQVKIIEAVIK